MDAAYISGFYGSWICKSTEGKKAHLFFMLYFKTFFLNVIT